ncbi:hypothetical protein C2S52_005613 [Perilla frutescens var. hirtella]|nr:hypothetical protein C2S52_005613 [Perilla frutescens var. hirtella]
MADFRNVPSSFFMFCTDDFANKLSIPLAFGNQYKKFLRQPYLELKTESGRSWMVKAKKMNKKWFFTDGWSRFTTDNQLNLINLLTFRISGESALDVSIFRNDCCKEVPSPPPSAPADDEGGSAKTWRFVKKLMDHNISNLRMDIPKTFVTATGIKAKQNIELENEQGRRWTVSVTDRNIKVFALTAGWVNFVRGNNFQAGQILLFEFARNSGNVVKVVVVENEAGKELLARARKGGLLK